MRTQYDIKLIAAILGLHHGREGYSKIWLSERMRQGLPGDSLVRVHQNVLGGNVEHLRPIASRSTLIRARRGRGLLSPLISEKVVRLAQVWIQAQGVYKDDSKARRFLAEPHMMLRGLPPLTVAVTNRAGLEAVEQLIGRLRFGSAP
ncbi:antitoxin Xre/MbcA/ParS toxin-binding domain-containing protein [Algiphilus sp.]|uniref:antitoxin Xre/MbcA/ParS toxin-binding domain-containing protein n=2 Tax=Algiphilus sp. TaxID=1872431 RepID=UPI0032F02663